MAAQIIDGKAIAKDLRAAVEAHAARLGSEHGIKPGLAVVLVGDDPASAIYVASKEKMTVKLGMNSFAHRLPGDTKQEDLLALIRKLNADKAVHGILVQMPLPKHLDPDAVLRTLDAAKDVDGLHVESIGRLVTGQPGFAPCTPQGCIRLIRSTGRAMEGAHAVVLGRSNLVGRPVSQLLLHENCTVTMCHSRTKDLADHVRRADIIVAATGRPGMVRGDWVKKGAIVIDVGINRMDDGSIVGDVDYEAAAAVADFITPVPGGVGPMTIACLLSNTIKAACLQNGLPVPGDMA